MRAREPRIPWPLCVMLLTTCFLMAACEAEAPVNEDGFPSVAPDEGFHLDEGSFTVYPGDEVVYCMRIPMPDDFTGRDLVLVGWDSDLPEMTHHYYIAYSMEPLDSEVPVPCDGSDPIVHVEDTGMAGFVGDDSNRLGEGKLLFGSGVGMASHRSQGDYGKFIKAGGHFVTNHHALNFTPEPVEMYGRFNILVRDADEIPYPTNQLNCLSMDIDIPPNTDASITATCIAPYDLDLMTLGSHGHQHLTRFETRLFDGEKTLDEVIYESTDWDSPNIVQLETPIRINAGQGISFTCHYSNPKDVPVVYGLGVNSEMCATMNGYAYPPGREYEVPPSLGTLILDNEIPMDLVDTTGLTNFKF